MGEIVFSIKLKVAALLVMLALLIGGLFLWRQVTGNSQENLAGAMTRLAFSEREIALLELMSRNFVSRQGLIVDKIEGGEPQGHVLLESMGQLMEYSVITGNDSLFKASWDNTVKCLRSPEGFFYWRVSSADLQPDDATALVDEMRVFYALTGAARVFRNTVYEQEAVRLARSVLKYNVEGERLHDSYDAGSNSRDGRISLFFIDPPALLEMARLDPELDAAGQNALKTLRDAPMDEHGFFPAWYDYRSGEYRYPSTVNMVEALYTARNAREAGIDISLFTDFLKKELSGERLYNSYNRNGTPAVTDESTAVYALACRLLLDEGELAGAKTAYRRMTDFQISETGNTYDGGFGDNDTKTFYAFDQLEALITLHIGGKLDIED